MGSTLTGSTVSSTYTGLLKITDTSAVTSTLKTISDGSGNDSALQVSTTAVNTTGDFSVATNKLTVASASGNTVVAGTLGSTGNFAVNTNKFTVAAATGNTVMAGNATVSGSASVVGDISTNGRVVLNGSYGVNQNSASGSNLFVGTVTFNNTTTFTAAPVFSTNVTFNNNVTVNGTATLAGVSALNGNITLGDASSDTITVNGTPTFNATSTFNGDLVIGSDSADTLTVNSAFDPTTVTVASNDFVLIQDVSDSKKIKKVAVSSVGTTVTVKESGLIAVPAAMGAAQYTHNLGVKPTQYQAVFVCVTDNNGYVTGDELDIASVLLVDKLTEVSSQSICGYRSGFSVYCDSTTLYARRTRSLASAQFPIGGGGSTGYDLLVIPSKNVGDLVLISSQLTDWNIKFKAINI